MFWLGSAGCARTEPAAVAPAEAGPHLAGPLAAALVFEPIVTRGVPLPELSREERGAVAFGGFVSPVITTNFVQLDDRQLSGPYRAYDVTRRRTVSTRVFVTER